MNFAVMTLSDSGDDSDDLPSFADRVKRLINSEVEEVKVNTSPKKNVSSVGRLIHSISDSDDSDSRETIPYSREKSLSPVFHSPERDLNEKVGCITSENNAFDLNKNTKNKYALVFSSPERDLNEKDDCISSDDNALNLNKKAKNKRKKENNEKDKEKELKKKVRLEKRKEKELIKALKASEKEIIRSQKPAECIKNMKIILDHNILYLERSQSVLNSLDQNNLQYSIEENICKYSVNWYRKVVNLSTCDNEILKEERDELQSTVMVIIPNEDFIRMVYAFVQKKKGKTIPTLSLEEFVVSIKSLYAECDITCVTVGFSKYMRNIKEEDNLELKTIAKQIHKNAPEEVVTELQLQLHVNFRVLENMTEFGNLLYHFTKAVAEAPQKKEENMQKSLAFSWYADVDSQCPVKLSKDSSSFIKLWKQQIQQFQSIGPEVAEAIVSRYPSPRSLLKAYKRCVTVKDAENVLKDILVRRNYGPLGTQKRIGPELAYKLYIFFTSRDGNKLLKR